MPEGHDVTPKPSRKKERERERERDADTRPITLSSAILKWFAQLLLLRGGNRVQEGAPLQWAAKGKQTPELLVVLRRRVVRQRVSTWLVKLDVRKAFDSVWQESMGDMVAAKLGGLRTGGGGMADGMPWEARAWLGLLEAREVKVAMGARNQPHQNSHHPAAERGAARSP